MKEMRLWGVFGVEGWRGLLLLLLPGSSLLDRLIASSGSDADGQREGGRWGSGSGHRGRPPSPTK